MTQNDEFFDLLAEADDALATGMTAEAALTDRQPAGWEPRLEKGLDCLRQLQRLRPVRHDQTRQLGRFSIRRELGRGGFGVVFLADDPRLGRPIALKVPRADFLADEKLRNRFHTEARAAARLDHPNIVAVYEAGDIGPVAYIASAYCAGPNLAQWLRQTTAPVPWRAAAELIATLANAVDFAHRQGVLHRDLKPANVILQSTNELAEPTHAVYLTTAIPKIADFGLARLIDADPTQSRGVLGTPSYMPPEQAAGGAAEMGPTSDVYSLGAILYELWTGRPPFQGETALEVLCQLESDDPVSPSRLRPGMPRDLETICLKCLEKEQRRRYATAGALADDLRRCLRGEPIRARAVGRVERAWRWARRFPAIAGLTSALVVALTVGVVGITWKWRDAEAQRTAAIAETALKEQALDEAEANLGHHRIALAQREWQINNLAHAEGILDEFPVERRGWEWSYLKRLCHPEVLTINLDAGVPNSIVYRPDGNRLATSHKDGKVRIWNAATGQAIRTLSGPQFAIHCIAYSPDGARIAAVSAPANDEGPGDLFVWDAETGAVVLEHRDAGSSSVVAFSSDGSRVVFNVGPSLQAWDLAGQTKTWSLNLEMPQFASLAVSPDGRQLAVRHFAIRDVSIVDPANGTRLRSLDAGTKFYDLVYSRDGRQLVSTHHDRTIRLWDVDGSRPIRTVFRTDESLHAMALAADGRRVCILTGRRTLREIDLETGREHPGPRVNVDNFGHFVLSPDGRSFAGRGVGNTVRVWPWLQSDCTQRRVPADVPFNGEFSRDGGSYLTLNRLRTAIDTWDATTWRPQPPMAAGNGPITCAEMTEDGRELAVLRADREVELWDLGTNRIVTTFGPESDVKPEILPELQRGPIEISYRSMVYTPDGGRLAIALRPSIRVFDCGSRQIKYTIALPTTYATGLLFDRVGRNLAAALGDHSIHVWDAESGTELCTLAGHTATVRALCFTPNNRRLATAGDDRTIRLWDADNGRRVAMLRGHADGIVALAFTPDGTRLASADTGGAIKLWDLVTGREVLTIAAPWGGSTIELKFSPDGQQLTCHCSGTGTITTWDARPLP